jgi:hypothetical protein
MMTEGKFLVLLAVFLVVSHSNSSEEGVAIHQRNIFKTQNSPRQNILWTFREKNQ